MLSHLECLYLFFLEKIVSNYLKTKITNTRLTKAMWPVKFKLKNKYICSYREIEQDLHSTSDTERYLEIHN